jgi:hypothetical protein
MAGDYVNLTEQIDMDLDQRSWLRLEAEATTIALLIL